MSHHMYTESQDDLDVKRKGGGKEGREVKKKTYKENPEEIIREHVNHFSPI